MSAIFPTRKDEAYRYADMDALADVIVKEIAKVPTPKDGVNGLGITDVKMTYDGEREFTITFSNDDQVKEFKFSMPIPIHRGSWKPGPYVLGDMVIRDGSLWYCKNDTVGVPGASPDWVLTAKRGKDGKDTQSVKVVGPVKSSDDDKT